MNRLRVVLVALVTAPVACGTSGPSASPESPSPSAAPSTHRLTLSVFGAGRIQTGIAADCRADCAMDIPSPTRLTLVAIAETGNSFAGWSGACTGTGDCSVSVDADRGVTATFSPLAPSPSPSPPPSPSTKRFLTAATNGSGMVTSVPSGIECPGICTAEFDDGATVTLTAHPGVGWQFAGWTGACSGMQGCTVTVGPTLTEVGASFGQSPLPAAAECDGLLPAGLPEPIVAALEGGADCIESVSDDGTGTFALGYERDLGVASFREWRFFTIAQGKAVSIAAEVPGEGASLSSQPSGFTRFGAHSPAFPNASLTWYSHDGTPQSDVDVRPEPRDDFHFQSRAAADPSGGMVVVRSHMPDGEWLTEYERFDKGGRVEVPWVSINRGPLAVAGVGVALSGDVLVLGGSPSSFQNQEHRQARWLARDGTPLTDWFDVAGLPDFPTFDFLVDGSLVVRDATRGVGNIESRYQARFEDGRAEPSGLPDWLSQRSTNPVFVVRGGKGYASWGRGGSCGGQLEVLAASGRSCGCIPVPHLGLGGTIGRDGSLMVNWTELHRSGPGTCKYDLYPQLLK
jgi:hypothetical protein